MTATTIFFDGRLTAIPGVETRVDASALEQVGLGASGVVGLIGTGVGGRPVSSGMTVDQIIQLTSPRAARDTFRSGDLREACSVAFEPSTDAAIPGGAQTIIAMKVNQATQATAVLSNTIGDALTLTSEDWGEFTNQIKVSVGNAGAGAFGRLLTVVLEATTESGDGVGQVDDTITNQETALFQLDYEPSTLLDAGWETMTADVLPTGTVRCYGTRTDPGLDGDVDSGDTMPGGADTLEVLAAVTSANMVSKVVTVYGLNNAGTPAPVSEQFTLHAVDAAANPIAGTVTFSKVLGVIVDQTSGSGVATDQIINVREASGNTVIYSVAVAALREGLVQPSAMFVGGTTIVGALDAAPGGTRDVAVWGLAANGAAASDTLQFTIANGAVAVRGSTNFSQIDVIALGDMDAGRTLTISAVAAQTNGSIDTLTKVQDYFNARQVDNVAAGAQEFGFTFTMRTAQTGLDPALLDWTNTPTNIFNQGSPATAHAGFSAVLNAMVDYYTTSSDLVTPTRTAFTAKLYTLSITTEGIGDWDVTIDGVTVTYTADGADTVTTIAAGLVLLINNHPTLSQYVLAASTAGVLTVSGSTPRATTGFITTIAGAAGGGTWALVLTTAQAGSGQPPDNVTNQFLSGGGEGVAAGGDWQEALDQLRKVDCNTIVVLSGDPAVHSALEAHCAYMGGAGKSERDGIVGLSAVDSDNAPTGVLPAKASIKSQVLSINSRHIRACAQTIDRPNTAGVSTTFMPWFQAAGAAGMQAGSPVGTSLTRKTMKVAAIAQDSSWDPVEDAHEMILAGLWFMEAHRTGRRCVRNITTYLQSVNLAFVEASVNEAVNFTVFNFRNAMETVVGEPGFAGTLAAGKSAAQTSLNLQLREGAVIQWRALSLTLAADVMDVSVEVAPIIPVNFVRATVHLVTLSQAA